MKQVLFEYINTRLAPAREEYERLLANPAEVERALRDGAEKARAEAGPYLKEIRSAIGIRPLG